MGVAQRSLSGGAAPCAQAVFDSLGIQAPPHLSLSPRAELPTVLEARDWGCCLSSHNFWCGVRGNIGLGVGVWAALALAQAQALD